MADSRDAGHVPTWDGSARNWRRYTREVAWYVQSTPVYKRRYCASKLMGKLTGPARLLAMSWPQMTFDAEDGTKRLLQRLAGSPLVRKSLPNAAAICQQYFSFRRGQQESMGSFLVRETLVHEEFVEALIRLHEEQLGISQDSRDFGLPPVEPEDTWENPWWGSAEDYQDEDASRADGDQGPETRPAGDDQELPDGAAPEVRGATGSSPSHRNAEATPTEGEVRDGPKSAIDEMSVADSFIMGVLRGWRLLQAAGLSAEEKRDILSTTRNSLNYEVISQALQGLWDEQLLGHRPPGGGHLNYVDNTDASYLNYQDYEEDWDDGWSSWWDESTAYYQEPDDDWWDGSWESPEAQAVSTVDGEGDDDGRLREAQQAEQVAEALASEAQRTWTEAQKATAALRKDRGFGAVVQKGGPPRCYNCGGPHFVRDCPRQATKGKGKGIYNVIYDDYYTHKGKGKSKGKVRPKGWVRNSMMEAQAQWMKGKTKGKPQHPMRTVNAYATEAHYLGGLELRDSLDLASASTSVPAEPQEHIGMLDSGATASAAPEMVIRGLISSILTMDKSATVDFDASARPYFRFGNGRWGRALSRVSVTSRASGVPVTFSLYMLPNPPTAITDRASVPPLLVGMDFIHEVGLLVDFRTGLAMNTREDSPVIYELPRNRKGHLMVDVRHHLTKGQVCDHGHVHASVLQSPAVPVPDQSNNWLELSTMWIDMSACDEQFDQQERAEVEAHMWKLFEKARDHDPLIASASTAQMNRATTAQPNRKLLLWTHNDEYQETLGILERQTRFGRGYNQHIADTPKSNAHGEWVHCAVCDLRLSYTPREGSHGQTTSVKNPAMVQRMLDELQPLMGDFMPTATICKAMQAKIDAEETLRTAIIQHKQSATTSTSSTMVKTTTRRTPQTPDSSNGSWQMTMDNDLPAAFEANSWSQMRELRRVHQPQRLWISLPCDKWCPWNRSEKEWVRRQRDLQKGNKLIWSAVEFVKDTLIEAPDTEIYWEWTHPTDGLSQPALRDLASFLDEANIPWLRCRVDGCVYDLRDPKTQGHLQKKWLIMTTDEKFHNAYRAKVCHGGHRHDLLQDIEVNSNVYYPWKLCCSIARHWSSLLVPVRHLRLLHRREDLRALLDAETLETNECDHAIDNTSPSTTTRVDDAMITIETNECDDAIDNNLSMDFVLDDYAVSASGSFINDYAVSASGSSRRATETMAKEARRSKDYSFEMCTDIVESLQGDPGRKGQLHSRGNQPGVTSLLLGGYSHGKFSGVSRRTMAYPETVQYINEFLRRLAPQEQWSSLQITYGISALPHRDVHNLRTSRNILVGLGSYTGGELWVYGDPPGEQLEARRLLPDGSRPRGYLLPTHHKVAIFDPMSWHATQRWSGRRIVISAYTTRLIPWIQASDRKMLTMLGFPLTDPRAYSMTTMAVEQTSDDAARPAADERDALPPPPLPEGVTQQEVDQWQAKVAKLHKAGGHPTNRNLARIVSEAGHPQWKIQIARDYQCPTCSSLRPGGTSSKQIPPASTHKQYAAWEAVAVDAGEWVPPNSKKKINFLLFMDVATKLRIVQPLETYDFLQRRSESSQDFIKAFAERWLGTFPKPRVLLLDSAKSFISEKIHDFASDLNLLVHYIAEKESWAHGTIEAAVQDVKMTASAIHLEARDQPLDVTLQLAVSALNSTEFTAGFSAYQWAFGRNFSLTDEDHVTFQQMDPSSDFVQLVTSRQKAEEIARTTRAKRVLTKLSNTSVRQPLRLYNPMDLVKVWRRVWPQTQHKGPKGGFRMSARPHWVGPGRVVFSEVLPHQERDDDRRHIVWVLIGKQLFRCSTHSVRPVSETERFEYETTSNEDPSTWKSLSDLLPKREYYDLTDQIPEQDEVELPDLPPQPNATTTVIPRRRLTHKTSFRPGDYVNDPVQDRLQRETIEEATEPPSVNDYNEPATSSTTLPTTRPSTSGDDQVPKRAKVESHKRSKVENYDLRWVEELEAGAAEEQSCGDLFSAMEEVDDFLRVEIDIGPLESHRQQKMFLRNPVAYMVKKMRDTEVVLSKLPPHERELFARAKAKEVDSFLKNEAVRKCLDQDEVRQAYGSQRIVKARWVLTWKLVPTDEQKEAQADATTNPKTLHDAHGRRKAKARIVLLGFQHPSLLDPSFKTSSPVQSTLGRNLLYLLAAHYQWSLEGLDLATAFLQTNPTAADEQLWTTGVQELREALGIEDEGIMRILRNIYGSTTAPRGLWLDLHKKLTQLGGIAVLGERCLWVWFSKQDTDAFGFRKLLGAMGGHVDDFHRVGNKESSEWLAIRDQIDKAYKWGMAKTGSYRHAGTDVSTEVDADGYQKIVVDQSYYIEGLQDIEIPPERLMRDDRMTSPETAACRAALGALQWLAVQSQPQLCSRCNLLLTETVTDGTLTTAREIQYMINEVRRESYKLQFFRLPKAKHWTEIVFISMGDQAHGNRAKGDSTGGMVTLAAGPVSLQGVVCPMVLLGWRTWKLKRKAIGSNDAEVQSIVEAEDQNFRVRLLWTEMNGAGLEKPMRKDLVETMEQQVVHVKGVLCTDSRGGYDAVEVNESPLLGLSNMRSALQAFQLRDNLRRAGCGLRWVNSEYDLADALTKKRADARAGLIKFLQTWHWSIAFDPSFTSAKKSKKAGRTAVGKVDEHFRLQGQSAGSAESFLGLVQRLCFDMSAEQL
ncbi:Smyd3 [Symbiodinium sp. CCMP2592]|nr:Smyd3 [Symbiodinium sp. CCMP2592]